jgi:hypothetical protein
MKQGKLFVIIFLILAVASIYIIWNYSFSDKNNFKDVGPFQQYWLDPYAYNPYFAPDIYIVPGQAKLSHNVNTVEYDNSYLPYESSVPAVDILRANNQILPPSYYSQVIKHNTTPYSVART